MSKDEVGTDAAEAATAGAPNGLLRLIEILEQARDGARELDNAIAETIHDGEWRPYAKRAREKWFFDRKTGKTIYYGPRSVPWFTSSIEAALSLIESGVEYSISTLYGIAHCEVGLNLSEQTNAQECRRPDGNVALALCTAALKTRFAIEVADRQARSAVAPDPVSKE